MKTGGDPEVLCGRSAATRRWVAPFPSAGLMMLGGVLTTFHALWTRNHSVSVSIREDALWATYQTDREATSRRGAARGAGPSLRR